MGIENQHRRDFVKSAAIGSLSCLSLSGIVTAAFAAEKVKPIALRRNDMILFQGDSITDGNRDRTTTRFNEGNASRKSDYNDFNSLGALYVFAAASELLYKHPDKNLRILNRGISGDKVFQLNARWEEDCLKIKPDVLSLLVGVNDYWHALVGNYNGTLEVYQKDLRALLNRTKQALPDVKLIIGEPFAIKGGAAITDKWYPAFNDYRLAAREISDEFKATFIPYQSIFDAALALAPGNYWSFDGVHPSVPGAQLMAQAWLNVVKA